VLTARCGDENLAGGLRSLPALGGLRVPRMAILERTAITACSGFRLLDPGLWPSNKQNLGFIQVLLLALMACAFKQLPVFMLVHLLAAFFYQTSHSILLKIFLTRPTALIK
jgi:hypothetical protein